MWFVVEMASNQAGKRPKEVGLLASLGGPALPGIEPELAFNVLSRNAEIPKQFSADI